MAGVATRRCDSCGQVVMLSDRGRIERVGEARYVGQTDGRASAICPCGQLVGWARVDGPARTVSTSTPLEGAHPRNGQTCAVEGHLPLSAPPAVVNGGRATTSQNICTRCGAVYATDALL